MGARESLQRLADRKSQEINDLEHQIDMARVYLQAIQDSIKALPRETSVQSKQEDESLNLRPGTLLARAKEAIQKNGAPMHISTLLASIGIENTKKSRVSLVGSLGAYVRKGLVFTRPAPNTFGLITFEENAGRLVQPELPGLPQDFGNMKSDGAEQTV